VIYLVEDDAGIRELVCYALRSQEYECVGFEDAASFWSGLENSLPDLFILDIMLPDESGLEILAKLKASEETAALPVLMLTAMGSELDRVKGLDAGADDYMSKPFSVLELLARVRALFRRINSFSPQHESNEETTGDIVAGGLSLNLKTREVKVNGNATAITFKEFELLYHFLQHKNMVQTREQLLTHIWGYEYDGTSNRTVDMHIKTLRQKLGPCGDMIKTIRGVGYKITWDEESL